MLFSLCLAAKRFFYADNAFLAIAIAPIQIQIQIHGVRYKNTACRILCFQNDAVRAAATILPCRFLPVQLVALLGMQRLFFRPMSLASVSVRYIAYLAVTVELGRDTFQLVMKTNVLGYISNILFLCI